MEPKAKKKHRSPEIEAQFQFEVLCFTLKMPSNIIHFVDSYIINRLNYKLKIIAEVM